MTWVKLCGMTRREDVLAADRLGADAVGFVTHPASRRATDPHAIPALGEGVAALRFLVTVDLRPGALITQAEQAGVDGVQPHGAHAAAAARAALGEGYRVLFPIGVRGSVVDLSTVPDHATPLLDAAIDGLHGGTGRSFDWSLASDLGRPVVLAGGLTPASVAEAIDTARPWGVDVASGIEQTPGVKDHGLMEAFVREVRR